MSAQVIAFPVHRPAIQTDWWWVGEPPRVQWGAWYEDDDRDEVCGIGDTEQAAIAALNKFPPREE